MEKKAPNNSDAQNGFEPDFSKLYARLRPFYETIRKGRAENGWHFQNCLNASFAKAYEFNVLANSSNEKQSSFFLTAGLRSICEDLILLRYLAPLSEANRNRFIQMSMWHEVLINLNEQNVFFSENRPFQMVLDTPKDFEAQIVKSTSDLQLFWKQRGWKLGGKNVMPQIRQLAERRGVETLYDFLYRLTCDVVHFNPQVLLRSGWGNLPDVEFSTQHFDLYYKNFTVIYGSLLFCLYFQLLKRFLKADARTIKTVKQIQKMLVGINRWPELVTFEEMNIKSPWDGSPILQVLHRVMAERKNPRKRKTLLRLRRRSMIAVPKQSN
jgi:hypothetical protein